MNMNQQDITEKLNNLKSVAPWSVGKENYERIADEYFVKKCPKSKSIFSESCRYLPESKDFFKFSAPFSLCFSSAKDGIMLDMDDNEYIDFYNGEGCSVLGVGNTLVKEKISSVMKDCGSILGATNKYDLLLLKAVNRHMPSIDVFKTCSSSKETYDLAFSLAKSYTKKTKILKIGTDNFSVYSRISDYPEKGDIVFLPTDSEKIEEALKLNKCFEGTACIIMEPYGIGGGLRPYSKDFVLEVRQLAKKYGALFILDESSTAFRNSLDSAVGDIFSDYDINIKESRDFYPDLVIFGNSLSLGDTQFSALGGKQEVFNVKKTIPTAPVSLLSTVTAYMIIEELTDDIFEKTVALSESFALGLEKITKKYDLPFAIYRQGTVVHIDYTGVVASDFLSSSRIKTALINKINSSRNKNRLTHLRYTESALTSFGVLSVDGMTFYMTSSFTEERVEKTLKKFETVFKMMTESKSYRK